MKCFACNRYIMAPEVCYDCTKCDRAFHAKCLNKDGPQPAGWRCPRKECNIVRCVLCESQVNSTALYNKCMDCNTFWHNQCLGLDNAWNHELNRAEWRCPRCRPVSIECEWCREPHEGYNGCEKCQQCDRWFCANETVAPSCYFQHARICQTEAEAVCAECGVRDPKDEMWNCQECYGPKKFCVKCFVHKTGCKDADPEPVLCKGCGEAQYKVDYDNDENCRECNAWFCGDCCEERRGCEFVELDYVVFWSCKEHQDAKPVDDVEKVVCKEQITNPPNPSLCSMVMPETGGYTITHTVQNLENVRVVNGLLQRCAQAYAAGNIGRFAYEDAIKTVARMGAYVGEILVHRKNIKLDRIGPKMSKVILEIINDNCQVCGGDHSPETQLMCDKCDKPWHTICVGLDSVPDGEWYCPKCALTPFPRIVRHSKAKKWMVKGTNYVVRSASFPKIVVGKLTAGKYVPLTTKDKAELDKKGWAWE